MAPFVFSKCQLKVVVFQHLRSCDGAATEPRMRAVERSSPMRSAQPKARPQEFLSATLES
jgi:hypothetical protein